MERVRQSQDVYFTGNKEEEEEEEGGEGEEEALGADSGDPGVR